jgi:hypothetical protein
MRSFDEALALLGLLAKDVAKLQRQQKEILSAANLNAGDRTDRADAIAREIEKQERERIGVLRELVTYPPRYIPYAQPLKQFVTDAACEKSVFVMTKYPDGKDLKKDTELKRVIAAVTGAVKRAGFEPRLASSKKYHPNLWENVEVYLLGCCRGIAIVEDKFKKELNPNVAMEWGWMRAMGKKTLYLVEKDMKVLPADVNGLIKDRFDWDNPEPGVERAVFVELTGAPPPVAAIAV